MSPRYRNSSDDSAMRDQDPKTTGAFLLGEWRVDPRLNRITGPTGTYILEPKLMDLLKIMASRPGQVFSRDELLDSVWPDVVVGEEVLTRGISELRRLLADDPRDPRYIESIRKGGYRIIAERHAIPCPSPADNAQKARPEGRPAPDTAAPSGTRSRRWLLRALAGAVILAAAFGGYWILHGERGDQSEDKEPWRPSPLTSYPGNEVTPALSPDGRLVAFSWSGPQDENFDVYVMLVGDVSPLRLTEDPAVDIHPVWSPDGSRLAYIHDEGPGAEIRVVQALGGPSRRLISLPHGLGGGFSWSPDGASIVYATRSSENQPTRLYLFEIETGGAHVLTAAPPPGQDDIEPEFSPDGRQVAFIRNNPSGLQDIRIMPTDGGEPRCVLPGLLNVMGLDWVRSGRELLCPALYKGSFSLWRVNAASGAVSWSSVLGDWIYTPSVARHANRLVYHHYRHEKNIWRLGLEDERGSDAMPVIASTYWDSEPSVSLDGGRLAFTSTRSGILELWISESDGSDPIQMTTFGGCLVTNPRWSPDGDLVAFNANPDGSQSLYILEVDGGHPERLDSGFDDALLSGWSRDGRWVYFSGEQDGLWDIWRLEYNGSSSSGAERITAGGAIRGFECADGFFYYSRAYRAGLWRFPSAQMGRQDPHDGGDQPWFSDLPAAGSWDGWAVCGGELFLLVKEEETRSIMRLDPTTGRQAVLAQLPGDISSAVALDGECATCYFARIERELGDLMLVEGFR